MSELEIRKYKRVTIETAQAVTYEPDLRDEVDSWMSARGGPSLSSFEDQVWPLQAGEVITWVNGFFEIEDIDDYGEWERVND